MDLLRPTVYSGQKLQGSSKVAILKTKSVTIAFFLLPLSLSSLFLFLFLLSFLLLRYYDFGASRA